MKTGYLYLCLILFFACQTKPRHQLKKKELIANLDTRKASIDFIFGKWVIDSIAEDRIVSRILENSDTSYQGFNFDQKNRVQTVMRTARFEKAIPLCDFELKGDSLFFIRSGHLFQRYGVEQLAKNVIVLHGNFFITEKIKKKPSFYLSKRW